MTAVMSRETAVPTITVAMHRDPKFRMVVQESERPEDAFVLRYVAEVAMALNLSGAYVGTDVDAGELARLVVAGVRRVGLARVQELALVDRMANLLDVHKVAPSVMPEVAAWQNGVWSAGRGTSCTGAASALVAAATRDHGLTVGA
ncbi:hypothetical protein [Lentzea sp. NPDC055074]